MANLDELVAVLGPRFGVLAESSTTQLTVIARNSDVAIGDLFILPCRRGPDRMYVFRATEYANILNRTIVMGDVARNKLTMPDSYFAEDLAEEQLVELRGMVLGYAQFEPGTGLWSFNRPRQAPAASYRRVPGRSGAPRVRHRRGRVASQPARRQWTCDRTPARR